ncbi:MAG: alpha/beta hydrolase [Neomegalonema sp.]|nr:alpha/beta hydrolase [Neomegalonema sp.]
MERGLINAYTPIDGVEIGCGVHGPTDGAPVLLVQAAIERARIWRWVAPTLTADQCRVHCFETPLFGETTPRDFARLTERLMTALGLESAHLVVRSGRVAAQLGPLAGERIKSLTLIETGAPAPELRNWALAPAAVGAIAGDIFEPAPPPETLRGERRTEAAERAEELSAFWATPAQIIRSTRLTSQSHWVRAALPEARLRALEGRALDDQPERVAELTASFIRNLN